MKERVCCYLLGSFQPLTKQAIVVVRDTFLKNWYCYIRIYVSPQERGPKTPFSFDEIKAMWESAFDIETVSGDLEVLSSPCIEHGLRITVPKASESEQKARDVLADASVAYDRFGWNVRGLHDAVIRSIATFTGDWKKHLNGSSTRLLSKPIGSK